MMTPWPPSFASASATIRAARSVACPAGNGTTILTGLVGYWAAAPAPKASSAPATSARMNLLSMVFLLLGILGILRSGAHHVFARASGTAVAVDRNSEARSDFVG